MSKQDLLAILEPFGQQHLVQFWDELDATAQQSLADEIRSLDLAQINDLAKQQQTVADYAGQARIAEAPPAVLLSDSSPKIARGDAIETGEAALREGKVGMVLVAGGQGTRLGFPHPKGMFPLGPVSNRTLFHILFDRVKAIGRKYGKPVPFLLMTSPATHEATVNYLEENQYFGIPKDQVRIFCQGSMPAVDAETGNILLADKGQLFKSPDGHGGMLGALDRSGCLQWAKELGVEHFFYGQVDNPLLQICDPYFIGCHLLGQSELTSQVIRKRDALERVGNVVSVNGRVKIIEYSDLPEDAARQTNDDGSLKIWAGSIAVHMFALQFLETSLKSTTSLPFHIANKKVPFVNSAGETINPETPNAFKFERFVFDLMPLAENSLVVEVDRQQAFSPVKNAEGAATDTAATAKADMIRLNRGWLVEAGVEVQEGVAVEISPLWALDADAVKERVGGNFEPITQPTFLDEVCEFATQS